LIRFDLNYYLEINKQNVMKLNNEII